MLPVTAMTAIPAIPIPLPPPELPPCNAFGVPVDVGPVKETPKSEGEN